MSSPLNFRSRASTPLIAGAAALFLAAGVGSLSAQAAPGVSLDDPRVGLAAGFLNDAEQVQQNMRLVSWMPKPAAFDSVQGPRGLTFINSDLAFGGDVVYQGNFSGFMAWDMSNPAQPELLSTVVCATDQGDPSIHGNLLFVSAESVRSRKDCGTQGVEDGADRSRGVRIFDVSDPTSPQLLKNVETCRGSHTHTIVPHQSDPDVVYLYIGGSSVVRDASELAGCSTGTVAENPNTSQYRVDIVRVPLRNVQEAAVVGYVRAFEGLGASPGRAGVAADPGAQPGDRGYGPTGCHDLTSYPEYNLVAGSCGSWGILLDSTDPENPVVLDAISDLNFSLWHTAVFSNDASKVVFTDEWGGGTAPRCRATDPYELGGNTVLGIGADGSMTQHAYFKMPAAQTETENCVSHNGGLIPVPGRDLMVQGWYQGGVNVFDFTDPDNPFEIAYFDRGPISDEELIAGGSWGAYWYNGYIYSSELHRGIDVLELLPSEFLTQNEIDAAKLVVMEEYNPQSQPLLVWPAAYAVARAYLDQLARNDGLASEQREVVAAALDAAEYANGNGGAMRAELVLLATELESQAAAAGDTERVLELAKVVRELGNE